MNLFEPVPVIWARTDELFGINHIHSQLSRGMNPPPRVVEEGSSDRHHVGAPFGNNAFGLFWMQDHSNRHRKQAGLLLDRRGKLDLVPGNGGWNPDTRRNVAR